MNKLIGAAVEWLMDPHQRTLVTLIGSIALLAAVAGIAIYYLTKP